MKDIIRGLANTDIFNECQSKYKIFRFVGFCMYLQFWYLCMHVNTCAGMWVGGTLYSRGQRLMIHLPQLLSTLYTEQGFSHEPELTDWV